MKEEIITIFSDQKLQKIITEVETQYSMDNEEDVSLKSLLLSAYLLTRDSNAPYVYFETILKGILEKRNQNNYQEVMNRIIEDLFSKNENDFSLAMKLLDNFVYDGYAFHSFNSAFLPTIQRKGLVIEEKPWDNEKIDEIRQLFSNHQIKGVFGLYQGRKKTPIFFASNLRSSRFYAYSSPTWFRHFVSGGMSGKEYDKNAFFRRDYEGCKNNVLKLCGKAGLNFQEQNDVLSFFEDNWKFMATLEPPCVALVNQNDFQETKTLLTPIEGEKAIDYTKRIIQMEGEQCHILNYNIEPDKIIIFPYDLSRIQEVQPYKEKSL